jgi:Transposase IS116/IS110/IS902 family
MLDRELNTLMKDLAQTLLNVPGCGVLSAAVLVGETAGVGRFKAKDTFARFTGTAPIPVWSGSTEGKVRLNRGGNRLTNTALHMIAITQSRGPDQDAPTLRSSKPAARPAPRPSACCAAESPTRCSQRFALTPHIAAPTQQTRIHRTQSAAQAGTTGHRILLADPITSRAFEHGYVFASTHR